MKQTNHAWTRRLLLAILATGILIGTAAPARAQLFVSPLFGLDFGGNARCPDLPKLTGCKDTKSNIGVSLGVMGNFLGFEEEFAYAPNFFGDAAGLSSNVVTIMSNVMIVPKIGPVHPYVEGGIGLLKTHVELTTSSVFATSDNALGWDVGGGLIGFIGGHVGVRGDLRYFHSFQDLTVFGLALTDATNAKIDYGRASIGLVLKF